jgi:putative CocE/NonD family hydrolase
MLGPRAGVAEQNQVEARADVLSFFTEPLDAEVEVTGNVSLTLAVVTDAPSTDFTAKLVDRHPDGTTYNVSDGILRRSYTPSGQPETIVIELWPTSMVFKKGHRIGLEISSSNYPRYDRNPNTGEVAALATRTAVARQTVHLGTAQPSRLLLSVVPRP